MTLHSMPARLGKSSNLAFVLVFLLTAGCGADPKSDEAKPPAPVEVEKADVDQTLSEWTELLGSTQPLPNSVARLTTAVEGQVSWVLGEKKGGKAIQEGQWVNEGDIIVKLDDRVFQANMARGMAGLDKLKNQQKQAALAVKVADVEVNRLSKLKAGGTIVAESEIEKAGFAVEDAKLRARSADEDLKVAMAELTSLKAQHAYFTLKAPIDGKLGRVEVAAGQTLAIGARVADIIDLKRHIDVLCFVPPSNIGKIQLHQRVVLAAAATPDDKAPAGEIVFKDDQAQPDNGSFAVKARFANDKLKLQANAVVRISVLTQLKKHCVTLPEDAVLEDQKDPVVVVVRKTKDEDKDEKEATTKAFRLRVVLGIRDRANKRIEVLDLLGRENKDDKTPDPKGLSALKLEQIVVSGGHGLQDKDPVEIKKPEEKDK